MSSSNLQIVVNIDKKNLTQMNSVYQSPKKALSYQLTQEYIVSKSVFYEVILLEIEKRFTGVETFSMLDLGMGTGEFLRYFLTSKVIKNFKTVKFYGVDISDAMIVLAAESVEKSKFFLKEMDIPITISISLVSGVNLLDANNEYYKTLDKLKESSNGFDMIFSSQFEHYFPNNLHSPLAKKLKTDGISYLTKNDFIVKCYKFLSKRGTYFSIDDRLGETKEEHIMLCDNWDSYIAEQFSNPLCVKKMGLRNRALTEKLYNFYSSKNFELSRVRMLREIRRSSSKEEIEKLSITYKRFINVFGRGNVFFHEHTSLFHKNFYLIYGVKV